MRYRYRNRVGYDTDIGIELDTIPISESSSMRYRYRNRVRYDTDMRNESDTIPIHKKLPDFTISIFDKSKFSLSISHKKRKISETTQLLKSEFCEGGRP